MFVLDKNLKVFERLMCEVEFWEVCLLECTSALPLMLNL